MNTGLFDYFRSCIVRIVTPTSTGTGFFISPSCIITCAHVVDDVPAQNVKFQWREKEYPVDSVLLKESDIALIGFSNISGVPFVSIMSSAEIGDELYSFGFSTDFIDGDSSLFIYEGPTSPRRNPLLKLKNAQAQKGQSGSPLLNMRTGKVCGIIKSTRDRNSDLGARAIPAQVLYNYFSGLDQISNKPWEKLCKTFGNTHSLKVNAMEGFENLGYEIIETVQGKDYDFQAKIKDGLIENTILVRVLDDLKNEAFDIARFRYEVASRQSLLSSITGLVIVRSISEPDRSSFESANAIKILTVKQVFHQSFDPFALAEKIVADYLSEPLSGIYIDLTCQVSETGSGTIYKPVEKFFDSFFNNTQLNGVAVLGNFGSGKSSLCRHYSYLLATRWLEDPLNHSFPIYINLRELESFSNFEMELFKYIQREYKLSIKFKGFRSWLTSKRILLLLDGFDEMATKLTKFQIGLSIEQLNKFLTQNHRTKIILTCRTHFFRTHIEENNLKKLVKLYILDWGADELHEYVAKSRPNAQSDTISVINNTYNLGELAKTPIFLKMITETIEEAGAIENHSKLYQFYTETWIKNQDYRSLLDPDEKQYIMEEVAVEMFRRDELTITYQNLESRIGSSFQLTDRENLKQFDKDIRTCSFLIRTPEGAYHFIHRSFMEFFLGLRMAKEVKAKNLETFSSKLISTEIAGFFAGFFEKDFEILLKGVQSSELISAKANFALSLGRLKYSKQIADCLTGALQEENNIEVIEAILDSLAAFSVSDVVNTIIEYATKNKRCRLVCLNKLISHSNHKEVIRYYKTLLEKDLKDLNKAEIVSIFRSIEQNKLTELRQSVAGALRYVVDSFTDQTILKSVTGLVLSIHNFDMAYQMADQCEALIERFDPMQAKSIQDFLKSLRNHYFAGIEQDCRIHFNQKQSYVNNKAMITKKYNKLIDTEHLKATLDTLYNAGRNVKSVKGKKGR